MKRVKNLKTLSKVAGGGGQVDNEMKVDIGDGVTISTKGGVHIVSKREEEQSNKKVIKIDKSDVDIDIDIF